MLPDPTTPHHASTRFRTLPPLRPDHFPDFPDLAHLIAFVQQLDLTPLQRTYAGVGSEPWPVEHLLVLALFLTHLGQPSPADWHRQTRAHVGLVRLLGGHVPARSTLYAFRDRLAQPLPTIHQTWLQHQRLTLPRLGQPIGIDGTFVALQASRHTLLSERGLERRLHTLRLSGLLEAWARTLQAVPPTLRAVLLWLILAWDCRRHALACPRLWPAWMARTPGGRRRQDQRYRTALQTLRERPRSAYAQRKCRRHIAPRISPSAPWALLGRDKLYVYRPLVNLQIAVDLTWGVATAWRLVPQVNDANQLVPMIQASAAACGVRPNQVAVDVGYAQASQLRQAQELGIAVYSGFAAADEPAATGSGKFTAADFRWDAAARVYRCPQGARLTYQRTSGETRATGERVALDLYQAPGATCGACPQSGRCLTNPSQGRRIKRLADEEHREACHQRSRSALGQHLRVARNSQVERVFGDGKEHRGQSRICGRSEAAAAAQLGLALLVFNAQATRSQPLH